MLTLLSDFGSIDAYVGVMKGVIAQINPHLTVVDLTHEIPPQNIGAARFCLMSAYPYFPVGTTHVAVVDPGVGSDRRAIAIELKDGFLVGPDNGLFSGVLSQANALAAVELTNPKYWRTTQPSATFHGRDIFAPVSAHIANGVPLEELGAAIALESLVHLPIPECIPTDLGVVGFIQYIDRFGNLITNIPSTYVVGKAWSVTVGMATIPNKSTYSAGEPGSLMALIGSHNWIEIVVNRGNAQSQLQMNLGDLVKINFS